MKKFVSVALVALMVCALVIPAMAANGNNGNNGSGNGNGNGNGNSGAAVTAQTIYLKGSGNSFKEDWSNVFEVAPAYPATTPNVWHLVYSGKNISAVTSVQITFTNGKVWNWKPCMGFSVNGGGNNFGWVIKAPYDWEIAYIDKGNNNVSGSFLLTEEAGNSVQFNISGFQKGEILPAIVNIEKIWLDHEGNVIDKPEGADAVFTINGAPVGGPGSYKVKFDSLEPKDILVGELEIDGFKQVNDVGVIVAEPDGDYTVVFTNKEIPVEPIVDEFDCLVEFTKTIGSGDISQWGGAFEFELWKGDEYINTAFNGADGKVYFELKGLTEEAVYTIREVAQDGWAASGDLAFTATAQGPVWVGGIDTIDNAATDVYGGLWAAVHLDVNGSDCDNDSGTNTVTMTGGTQYSTGQGWGFTYFSIDGLSWSTPVEFDIVGNGVVYGKATVSLSPSNDLIITIEGVSIKGGNESIKVMVTANESWLKKNNQGSYKFKSSGLDWEVDEYLYVVTIPLSYFGINIADFIS